MSFCGRPLRTIWRLFCMFTCATQGEWCLPFSTHSSLQLLKTDEEMKSVQREISKLKSTKSRNTERCVRVRWWWALKQLRAAVSEDICVEPNVCWTLALNHKEGECVTIISASCHETNRLSFLFSKAVVKKINEKISSLEEYLQQLKNSSSSISKHKEKRKEYKKMTIFWWHK